MAFVGKIKKKTGKRQLYTKGETVHKTIKITQNTQDRQHLQSKETNIQRILKNKSRLIRK